MSRFVRVKNLLFPASEIRAIYVKDNAISIIPTKPYKDSEYMDIDNCRFYRNRSEIEFRSEGEARITFDYLLEDLSYYQ